MALLWNEVTPVEETLWLDPTQFHFTAEPAMITIELGLKKLLPTVTAVGAATTAPLNVIGDPVSPATVAVTVTAPLVLLAVANTLEVPLTRPGLGPLDPSARDPVAERVDDAHREGRSEDAARVGGLAISASEHQGGRRAGDPGGMEGQRRAHGPIHRDGDLLHAGGLPQRPRGGRDAVAPCHHRRGAEGAT